MKRLLCFVLVLIMCFCIIGCAESNPSEKSDTGKTSSEANKSVVVYWSMWDAAEPQAIVIAQAVEEFEKKTGIDVDLQFKGRSGIREGLQPALDANQVVDLFDEDIDRINRTFAKYLFSLEDLYAKYNYKKTANEALIDACRMAGGGTLKTIPYQPNVFAFFYNKEIFRIAGVTEIPKTWDSFLICCQKIKDAGFIPITMDNTSYLDSFCGYHLGRLVGEERLAGIINNGEWDDPAVSQFAKDMEELVSKGYTSPNISTNIYPAAQIAELAAGKAAMYLNGSWLPNEVKDTAGENFEWGCFNYPAVNNGTVGVEAANFGAQVFGINNKSKVTDEAFQLIVWLTTGEWDAELAKNSLGIPSDINNTEWPAALSDVKEVMNSLSVRWTWAVGIASNVDVSPVLHENCVGLLGGTISADQFIANMMAFAKKTKTK